MNSAVRGLRFSLPKLDLAAKKRIGNIAGAVCGLFFLVLAVRMLKSELKPEVWAQVPVALHALPWMACVAAVVASIVTYVWLGVFDALGARVVRMKVSSWFAIRTGFIGYALTHNVGLSALTGTALRIHRYGKRGSTGGAVARLYLSNVVTMWLGFTFALGAIIAVAPTGLMRLSHDAERALGVGLVAFVLAYVVVAAIGIPAITVRGHSFSLPSGRLALAQVLMGAVEWIGTAAVLWFLLPGNGVGFHEVLAALCMAQVVVIISHVPGGVGVLEGTLLLLFKGKVDPASLAAALVLYRVVYFILPLALSVVVIAVEQLTGTGPTVRLPKAQPAVATAVANVVDANVATANVVASDTVVVLDAATVVGAADVHPTVIVDSDIAGVEVVNAAVNANVSANVSANVGGTASGPLPARSPLSPPRSSTRSRQPAPTRSQPKPARSNTAGGGLLMEASGSFRPNG